MADETSALLINPTLVRDDLESLGKSDKQIAKGSLDWAFFLVTQLGVFLALVDESFVISIHGEIASSFQESSAGSWLVTAYNLGYAVALPTFGRLADVYGRKSTLISAYTLFSIGCATTGIAGSVWMAIAGRLLAGVGGAGMVDVVSVILVDLAPLKEVAVLRSYMAMVCAVGVGCGGPLGGILADLLGWRWAFLVQVPLILVCIVMVSWRLSPSPSEKAKGKQKKNRDEGELHSAWKVFDLPGLFLLSTAISALMIFCRSIEEDIAWTLPTIASLTVASIATPLFLCNEAFWAYQPLTPLWLLKRNGIGIICLSQVLIMGSQFGMISSIGELMVRTQNASNSVAGLYLLPVPVGGTIGALTGGYMIRRTGKYKVLSLISLLIVLMSYILMLVRWAHDPTSWEIASHILCLEIGIGCSLSSLFVGVSASLSESMSSTGTTMYYLSQQMGILLGVTACSGCLRRVFEANLFQALKEVPYGLDIIRHVLQDNRFVHSLPTDLQHIVHSTFVRSFDVVPALCVCMGSVAVLLVWRLKEMPIE